MLILNLILSRIDKNDIEKKINVKIKRYGDKFLLFNGDKVIKIGWGECDGVGTSIWKTFLNGKEIK